MRPRYERQPNPNKQAVRNMLAFAFGSVALATSLFIQSENAEAEHMKAIEETPKIERVVKPGDTYWNIAGEQFEDKDVLSMFDRRELVEDLKAANPDVGDELMPGDILEVPADVDNNGVPELYEK